MNGPGGGGPPVVVVDGVDKSFAAVPVLVGLDLTLAAGSVTALLGPSGCGKTTALRIVAGLERPDAGTVTIGGELVAGPGVDVPTERRRVGMVFQDGALFPHLSVARNVGYGLARPERRGGARIDELLDLVGLSGFGDRMPDSLSGGQAQRVALARALAPQPSVVLMDEPFSNLDAVLRRRLRADVAAAVRSAGATVLVVTHDRDEAFTVADRVAVMRDGRIVQTGVPRELYRAPADRWVAAFLGDVNLLAAEVTGGHAATVLGRLPVASGAPATGDVVVRPEDLVIAASGAGTPAVVERVDDLGDALHVRVRLDDGTRLDVVGRAGPGLGVGSSVVIAVRDDVDDLVVLPLA